MKHEVQTNESEYVLGPVKKLCSTASKDIYAILNSGAGTSY